MNAAARRWIAVLLGLGLGLALTYVAEPDGSGALLWLGVVIGGLVAVGIGPDPSACSRCRADLVENADSASVD
ncbi:hypothetical protein [Thalassiella azotivora]